MELEQICILEISYIAFVSQWENQKLIEYTENKNHFELKLLSYKLQAWEWKVEGSSTWKGIKWMEMG